MTKIVKNRRQKKNSPGGFCAALLFWSVVLIASTEASEVAIIIDDMGYSYGNGAAALDLPGEITYAFLPKAAFTNRLSRKANAKGKEIMVHLPMQSMTGHALDDGALIMDMTRRRFFETLLRDIDAVPNAAGVNNHMGSLLTQHPGAMQWLMTGLKSYGNLYFVDSLTSDDSVARHIAHENGVASAKRDVFLDHDRDRKKIALQFQRLLTEAKRNGKAIGIAHPYPETISVLKKMLPTLAQQGVSLVKASKLVELQYREQTRWHASSFPSPKVVKNLKR
jgi:polysaccharide deacetylase 2 family uncharacterized protein YibQ